MFFAYTILAIFSGICLSIQGPVNTALSNRTDKFQATMLSFLGGCITLLIIVVFIGNGDLSKITEVKFWQLLGGAYGVLCVCSSVFAIPVIGVALMVTALMLGQLLSGAIIDYFGLLGCIATDVTPLRISGILVVAFGIAVIYFGSREKNKNNTEKENKKILMFLLCFFAGVCGAIQSPTNASLAKIIGNWESSLVSFMVGFVIISAVTLIVNHGKLKPVKEVGIKPWMLLGGPLGASVVFINLFTVLHIGTALQVSCAMAGQLIGGIAIDSLGLIQSAKIRINTLRIIGALIIVVGVIVIAFSKNINI